jgi:hypothetical protein
MFPFSVFRIPNLLIRIRIREPVPLITDPDSDPTYFLQWLTRCQTIQEIKLNFLTYYGTYNQS